MCLVAGSTRWQQGRSAERGRSTSCRGELFCADREETRRGGHRCDPARVARNLARRNRSRARVRRLLDGVLRLLRCTSSMPAHSSRVRPLRTMGATTSLHTPLRRRPMQSRRDIATVGFRLWDLSQTGSDHSASQARDAVADRCERSSSGVLRDLRARESAWQSNRCLA